MTKVQTYRLKPNAGIHFTAAGERVSQQNPFIKSEVDLAEKFPYKFERVEQITQDHPYGEMITDKFPAAMDTPKCLVFKKGRRYRIVFGGIAVETKPRFLKNELDVNRNLRRLLATLEAEDADDEDDMEPDDEAEASESEEEVETPEPEEEEEAEVELEEDKEEAKAERIERRKKRRRE